MELFTQIAGWVGMVLIVAAYFLVSQKKLTAESKIYQTINLCGAIAVGINVAYHHAYPALVLQIVWGTIALYEDLKKRRTRRKELR